jgi:DtxR family Mn-dependent transcriptional regulator
MHSTLSATLEDYLLAIYWLERERRVARPRDICRLQGVAKSTVTAALQSLAEKGLINYTPYEVITLAPEGQKRAEQLNMRHRVLKDFLQDVLGLEPEKAESTACGMEHAVEPEALERFICFLAFVKQHTPDGKTLLKRFREFAREGGRGKACRDCVEEYLRTLQPGSAVHIEESYGHEAEG